MKLSRTLICSIGFLLWGGSIGFAQITSDEALSKFVSAGMAYKDGRYESAIERYRTILDGGRESGALYYNFGNSYFKKGNLGKAVLNYERAKRFIPRDSDLNFNDTYVQSQIVYYSDNGRKHFIDSMIKSTIQFYTVDEMAIILVGLGIAIGLVFFYCRFIFHGPSQPCRELLRYSH